MPEPTGDGPWDRAHWERLIRLGAKVALIAAALLVLPDVILAAPLRVKLAATHPLALLLYISALLLLLPTRPVRAALARLRDRWGPRLAQGLPARFRPALERCRRRIAAPPRVVPAAVEQVAGRLLGWPAAWAAAAACALMLLTWAPHYLTWPWWIDTDQFAVSAQAWCAGIRPYRDAPDFDFPGPIYLFALLGRAFGWGRTAPFYAADVALLLLLGAALVAWSRRLFGRALPGLVGWLLLLGYYLGQDYTRVAQRDWQGPAFAIMAVLAPEAWGGRLGRMLSALAVGVAAVYRPQVVLLLPALISAVDERGRPPGTPWRAALGPIVSWAASCAGAVALAFGPLLWAGVLDDFVRVLSVARFGGAYNQLTYRGFRHVLAMQLQYGPTPWLLAATTALAVLGPEPSRRQARTWALALIGVSLYRPISPVQHGYLSHPMALVHAVTAAWLLGWLLTAPAFGSLARLAALTAALLVGVPGVPRYCSAGRSLRAIGPLVRGEDPADPPLGCADLLPDTPGAVHRWTDYRRLLDYLRHETPADVRVANALRLLPFPAINGPTGRPTPFPAAGGLIHLALVDPQLEGESAAALVATPGTLVVWNPDDRLVDRTFLFPRITRVIQAHYQPAARFGSFEVWERARSETPHPNSSWEHAGPRPSRKPWSRAPCRLGNPAAPRSTR